MFSYLLVDICPIVDQQLQTEGTVGGDGGQVQRGVATLVGLVDVSAVVDQLGSHCLLAHVARHMEGSVSKSIGLINLTAKHDGGSKSDADKAPTTHCDCKSLTHLRPHPQEVLYNFDVTARRGGVERCVALLILATFVCTARNQQLHHIHVPCGQHKEDEHVEMSPPTVLFVF